MPCTGAAHRTFDSAWTAIEVGNTVQMHYTPTSLRDLNRSTSAFGASSTCRTHSFGMPMDILNPMRLCTQTDNQPTDPFVPLPRTTAQPIWGTEKCTSSPFDVPWSATPPPNQQIPPASIGTIPRDYMNLLSFNGWDIDGPQPTRQCSSGADCCPECQCLVTPQGGICAILRADVFQCMVHAHCADPEKMCAGDGLCTRPALEVSNDASNDPISFRTYSSNCTPNKLNSLDTWGTSKEEVLPDILPSSGMCSYRSWYEHRQLIASGRCGATACQIAATETWNSTSPDAYPRPALQAGVLKLIPHACDMDYEHISGLTSCSPSDEFLLMDTASNVAQTLKRVNRTRTYRLSGAQASVSIVRQDVSNPSTGFFTPPAITSYTDLGYDTYQTLGTGGKPQLCSNIPLCNTQAAWRIWKVNGIAEANRLVHDNGVLRSYNTNDMISCGAAGFLSTLYAAKCILDPGVVPFIYIFCSTHASHSLCTKYANRQYTANPSTATLTQIASDMNGLLTLMRNPTPTTWNDYLDATLAADTLFGQTTTLRVNLTYADASAPTGLYYLFEYGAYELPFAWWFRCSWLSGIPPSASPTPCPAWPGPTSSPANIPPNVYTNQPPLQTSPTVPPTPLMTWLAGLPGGVFLKDNINAARNRAHSDAEAFIRTAAYPNPPAFSCHANATLRTELLAYKDYVGQALLYAGRAWTGAVTTQEGTRICDGPDTCLDHGPLSSTLSNLANDVRDIILSPKACNPAECSCTTDRVPSVCAYVQDTPPATVPTGQKWVPLFTASTPNTPIPPPSAMNTKYDPKSTGCNTYSSCRGTTPHNTCKCMFSDASPQPEELAVLGMNDIQPGTPPLLTFTKPGAAPRSLDICSESNTETGRCTLGSQPLFDDCSATSAAAQVTKALYCSAWANPPTFPNSNPKSSQCLTYDCLAGQDISNSRVTIPPGVQATVINAPAITCHTLICPDDPVNNGKTVLDQTSYTMNLYTRTRLFMYQIDYIDPKVPEITFKRTRNTQLIDDTSGKVIISAKLKTCYQLSSAAQTGIPLMVLKTMELNGLICHSNRKKTRLLSQDFDLSVNALAVQYNTLPDNSKYTLENYKTMFQDIIRKTEDFINTSDPNSNTGRICSSSFTRPASITTCNFTNPQNSKQVLMTSPPLFTPPPPKNLGR